MRVFSIRHNNRALVGLLGLTALTCVYLNGTRPGNRIPAFTTWSANHSWLSDRTYTGETSQWTSFLYGNRTRWQSMDAYVLQQSRADMQRNYGLLDAWQEARLQAEFGSLARSALGEWQSYQVSAAGTKLGKIANVQMQNAMWLQSLRTPGAIVGVAAAVATGRTLRYRLSEDVQLSSRTSMAQSRMQGQAFGVDSSVLNGTVDYSTAQTGPSGGAQGMKASLGRGIPGLDASAVASYTTGTQTRTLSLRKQLTDEVSVSYDNENSSSSASQHVVGFGFSQAF